MNVRVEISDYERNKIRQIIHIPHCPKSFWKRCSGSQQDKICKTPSLEKASSKPGQMF